MNCLNQTTFVLVPLRHRLVVDMATSGPEHLGPPKPPKRAKLAAPTKWPRLDPVVPASVSKMPVMELVQLGLEHVAPFDLIGPYILASDYLLVTYAADDCVCLPSAQSLPDHVSKMTPCLLGTPNTPSLGGFWHHPIWLHRSAIHLDVEPGSDEGLAENCVKL